MNPSRLKYLLIFVLSTLLNSVSFALHIDEYNDVLNEVELFILVGFLSIHTFPVFPSKRLYSTEKNLDRYLHAHESFLRFEFGSEVQRSVAVSSFYLGGTFGSSIDIFFAPKWSIQVYTCFCSILFVIGHLFSTFSFNWNLLAIGRFFLGVGIGITGKFAHGSYNPNSLALHSKCITQKFRILYQLTAAAGILFGGFLRQYFLNSHILAWRVFSRIHASLGILVFLFTMFHNWIATFNPKRLPLTLRLLSLSKRIPIPTQPKASSNFNIAKAFERAIKILKIFIALYIFQQLSLINRYFSYIEEILGDLPNIYMLLGVANFAGTFLNVAIEALKGEENTRDHYLARIANAFDMEYICDSSPFQRGSISLFGFLLPFFNPTPKTKRTLNPKLNPNPNHHPSLNPKPNDKPTTNPRTGPTLKLYRIGLSDGKNSNQTEAKKELFPQEIYHLASGKDILGKLVEKVAFNKLAIQMI
ncbi:hypothetical protein DI09_150p10 [Mitosporidium daphniae]|uniref:Major facilitator superfamily (MFS) profile domain-containing protein n=1 Tax=Mitosporidium daphniae TaxID=1485682 RepID=A0A098VUR9_9MICR|nr:uncharacterized protein DI09_150p10 [Mitosporidium daphniae]KGG52614.1 hypothetical protein DI09_150p10 [Mitosporidium daphniae]|eukprot:XP_013239050.1 uncharacterized protein DI09_150p10 [Mitosporidium daphniae]